MAWCDQSGSNPDNNKCNHDGLDPYIENIQTKFGNSVTVGILSKEQIEGCYTDIMPQWLCDFLDGSSDSYWTSTAHPSDSSIVITIYRKREISDIESVSNKYSIGLRPIITISKS